MGEPCAGIRYILFGDRLCRVSCIVRSQIHSKLCFLASSLYCLEVLWLVYSSIFSCHFRTSGHHVQKSLFSCIRGNILLPADFPAVKGIVHLCIHSDFHVLQVLHIVLNVKGIFLVIIGQLLVSAMLRYIEFI